MVDADRTFAVASDNSLVDLIRSARRRLVVIAPALTDPVADAIADRLPELGPLSISVIVDADPEVYRLGFGTEKALDRLREACDRNLFDLRVQFGVRIGVVVSDQITMVFSPVPQLIEAGSRSSAKPNAIILGGTAPDRLADAAGAESAGGSEKQEIGAQALTPEDVQAVKQDLKANPPQQFDIARALRVFNSEVQYVDLKVEEYRLSRRQVALPPDLVEVGDEQLREQISSRMRMPAIEKLEIPVKTESGVEVFKVDDTWFDGERKRIMNRYTFVVRNFGHVILRHDREDFDKEIARFAENLQIYYEGILSALNSLAIDLESRLVKEYLPKWQAHPPPRFARHSLVPTEQDIEQELRSIARWRQWVFGKNAATCSRSDHLPVVGRQIA